jgi:hypothetical protein
MRLPKDASEVVAAVIVPEETEVLVLTSLGSTKRVPLASTTLGNRSVKPRAVFKMGMNNRITGALTTLSRPEIENGETAVPQQLSLIDDGATETKTKKRSRKKAKTKK